MHLGARLLLALLAIVAGGCARETAPAPRADAQVAVLLVAHGSQSGDWNATLKAFAEQLRGPVLAKPGVKDLQLAFIDEPKDSIATRMRAFDAEGVTEVIVVPLFISTESTMTNDYLQYLTGMRSEGRVIKQLKNDGYDVYYPRARTTVTPALSSAEVLKKNVLRRVEALRGQDDGDKLGVLLVGYGDKVYGQQMEEVMQGIGRYLKIKTPMDTVAYAFCGNLVDYSGEPVAKAINEVLELEEQVAVVPVLLAVDGKLQVDTIKAAINAIDTPGRVRYAGDAVLPDPDVNAWAIDKIDEALQRVRDAGGKVVPAPNRG
jgi:sirohydrochlorin ferrochelatase